MASGTLKSMSMNGVKLYSITGQHQNPASWLDPKKQRSLRKDLNYQQRVELIQDLRFETATTKIKATPDGQFVIASGIYPPQIKVYELRELSLKFERHFISEIIDFQVLSDDYSKLAFLCADRSICLHAKYGSHHSLRIPRMGRDMTYDSWSCDLLCAASSPDLYRINLSQGRFLSPLATQSPALNVVSRSKLHGLVACGGEDGAVECFDMRTRSSIGRINAVSAAGENDQEVTAIAFDEDGGFQMAVGSSEGQVLIYDLRSSQPLRVKDHMYGSPILDIKWHRTLNSQQPKIISTDNHIVRIWDPETMEGVTSIEPTGGAINDICVFNESGLILLALDSSQIPSYFIPTLGPAPKWCSYLENLTEELEENGETTTYDNFKFLKKEDLDRLGMSNLIGTNLVRAYMHGFYVNNQLYKKVKSLREPFDAKATHEKRIKDRLEKEGRITNKRRLPKVNREKALQLLEIEEAEKENDTDTKTYKKKKKAISSDILKDDRFASMFENPAFQIDEKSQEYMDLHPVARKKLVEEHFEPVMDDEDSEASASSDDGVAGKKVPRLYEVKDERHAQAFLESVSLANEDALPLGERVAALGDKEKSSYKNVKVGPGGSREISFFSRSKAKYREDEDDEDPRPKKRGVNSLGLKPTNYEKRSGGRGNRGGGRGRGRGGRGRGRH